MWDTVLMQESLSSTEDHIGRPSRLIFVCTWDGGIPWYHGRLPQSQLASAAPDLSLPCPLLQGDLWINDAITLVPGSWRHIVAGLNLGPSVQQCCCIRRHRGALKRWCTVEVWTCDLAISEFGLSSLSHRVMTGGRQFFLLFVLSSQNLYGSWYVCQMSHFWNFHISTVYIGFF